ncbi:sarcosine oxidase subunit beta family protein [Prosthecodimorpha staleyi]|uniref:Sarcosine oxidase subunit beta n=1 Tax=Prosthecodimorpha staleyi TaxID=2840188 RepID=A0A947GC56_9HYPH|nr:sarcosine oxidase subunit beta family protein [Prosthecodimorpha staleyi]MBT9291018.1 sarcosine oxidase subunit beta family protein [Prosthecodimorpha staleyi]
MTPYSVFALARQALTGHRSWAAAWRDPAPRARYQVIVIGGGGHGLATAYYLAKTYGITDVAVLEKAWLGGGNTGRNTAIVRSNYLLTANSRFYEHALKLWEGLSADLNFNVMFSQRGMVNIAHSNAEISALHRRGNAMRLNGVDAELLTRDDLGRLMPGLDLSAGARFPILGGLIQKRGGTARHDAVAWGYARAADARGVDIIQNCEVTGLRRDGDRVTGVETTRGPIAADKVAICVAGDSGRLAGMAGLRLPMESHVLQALVSEPVKPMLDVVAVSGALHVYINQSDKGELVMGGDIDGCNSYAQRGDPHVLDHVVESAAALFPAIRRLRMMRSWGGTVDMTMDGSPIITRLPLAGLYLNGGWCYGGFKGTPAAGTALAHLVATDRPHPIADRFTLDRFDTGDLLDERGSGSSPWMH